MTVDRPGDALPAPGPTSGREAPEDVIVQIVRRELIATFWSGPLPPPEILKTYEEIVPGSGKQLIDTFDRQAHHRMELEKAVIFGDVNRANRGLWAAAAVALAFLIVAAVVILEGHDAAGIVIASVDIGSIVGVFVYGTETRRRERKEKAQSVPDPSQLMPPPQAG